MHLKPLTHARPSPARLENPIRLKVRMDVGKSLSSTASILQHKRLREGLGLELTVYPDNYPNSRGLGSKIHTLNGFLDLETLLFGHLES